MFLVVLVECPTERSLAQTLHHDETYDVLRLSDYPRSPYGSLPLVLVDLVVASRQISSPLLAVALAWALLTAGYAPSICCFLPSRNHDTSGYVQPWFLRGVSNSYRTPMGLP